MYINNQNLIPSINKYNRINGKDNRHSQSPNIRPIHSSNKPIQNALFPKSQLMFNNNNHNYIKINKISRKKEKIIEGDLNFNQNSKPIYLKQIQRDNYLNNKPKRRGLPNKSPVPIPASFKPKDILSFNRIFSSNSHYIRQHELQKFNKTNNMFRPLGNNNIFMNNYIFGGNLNANLIKSKSFTNIKKDRSHTPLLRNEDNKFVNIGIKANKNHNINKSPNLGKSTNFKKNGNFNIYLLNNNNNNADKKFVKKMPNGNNLKKMNINPNLKKNTVISGEIYQEPFKINKINNYNKQGNIGNINIRPISNNNNTLNISSNISNSVHNNNNSNNSMNVLKDNNSENLLKNNIKNLNGSNSQNNIRRFSRPKSPKNNPQKNKNHINNKKNNIIINSNKINNDYNKNSNNNLDKDEQLNIKPLQNISKDEESNNNDLEENKSTQNKKPINILNLNENLDSQKNNEVDKSEENKPRKDERSKSQVPINPLIKNDDSEEKEEINLANQKIKTDLEDPQKQNNKKVIKKIRDIFPYTHVGFDGEEPKENNQDNYFIFKNFTDNKDYIYMSVCDGHGVEGHFVSSFIKEVLPYYMSENLKNRDILNEKEITHQIITETFLIVNHMLVSNENINSLFSGTTCVSVIFTPERLIVPNIGDSRAVLARFDKQTGKYKAIELSRDHKPTEKDEAKRIYENNGRIQPFTEDGEFVGPQRVWIKEEEVPGLAMTRSFGDRVAATVGVMSEPEIKEFDFDENDKFMIIASDGIWEFISSQECVDIIQKYYENNDLKGCCDYLYQESSKRWLKEEEVIDDTTLILVFFD